MERQSWCCNTDALKKLYVNEYAIYIEFFVALF